MKSHTPALALLLLLAGPCATLAESEVCESTVGAPETGKSLLQVKSALAADGSTDGILGQHAAVATTSSKTTVAHGSPQFRATPDVMLGSDSENNCPQDYSRIVDEATCRAAMPFIPGGDPDDYNGASREADWPRGCYRCSNSADCTDGVWYNPHGNGGQQTGAFPVCGKDFAIEKGKTLFVGDSDVDYWHTFRTAVPDAYNVGIGGNTCKDALKEIDALLAAFEPAWVVLVCGENDLGGGTSVAKTFKRWTRVVGKISAAGARVVMMGTKPEADSTNLHNKYKQYDAKIERYVVRKAQGTTHAPIIFNDVFSAFTAMGNPDSLYDQSERPDFLHMGPPGYAHWNDWARAALAGDVACVVWEGDTCKVREDSIVVVKATTNECPAGFEMPATEELCHEAAGLVRGRPEFQGSEDEAGWPAGCYLCEEGVDGCLAGAWFNSHATGAAKEGAYPICKRT